MIRYDHYTDKFVKVSDKECPWCKAVCASTDKYCHECGWHIADTPQTDCEDTSCPYFENPDYSRCMKCKSQTESTGSPIGDYRDGVGAWQTDCGWGEPITVSHSKEMED